MKIRTKLLVMLFVFAIVGGILSVFALVESKKILEKEVGKKSILFAEVMMGQIDKEIDMRLDEIKVYAQQSSVRTALEESNAFFESLPNRDEYIAVQDELWRESPADTQTPLMKGLMENNLSADLRSRVSFKGKGEHAAPIFPEIFITNKFGANIAQSERTSDYRQDDEEWWQNARINGLEVEDISFDESANAYSTNIEVRVENESGSFIGVIKAVLNIDPLLDFLGQLEANQAISLHAVDYKVITPDGKVVYASEKDVYKPLQDISGQTFFSHLGNQSGYFVYLENDTDDEEEIFSYARSNGHGSFKGFGWILVIEYPKEELLSSFGNLNRVVIGAYIVFILFATGLGILLSYSISMPLSHLAQHALSIGKGNMSKSNIKRNDEVGVLALTLDRMVDDLKVYEEKLVSSQKERGDILEKEVLKKTQELQVYVQKLEQTNQHLKDLDKAKSDFLNVVSHELKTPLTAIFAYLDIVQDSRKSFSKEVGESLDAVRRNSEQLHTIISNILEISRIEAGRFELIHSKIDPAEKIKQVVKNLKPIADLNEDLFVLDVSRAPSVMMVDEQRFVEILNNLISNAIKFTKKGKITIAATKEREFLKVSVSDTGVGIPQDKLSQLFQNFYQVDASISRKYGGTGLGLSITKKLIDMQGGKIEVDSMVGRGSTFSFTLPLKPKSK